MGGLKLAGRALLGLRRPLVHRFVAQAAHLLDQQLFDLVGGAPLAALDLRQRENGLEALPQIRAASQPLDHLCFTFASRVDSMVLLHGFEKLNTSSKKYISSNYKQVSPVFMHHF